LKNPALCRVFWLGERQRFCAIFKVDFWLVQGGDKGVSEFIVHAAVEILGALFVRRSLLTKSLIIAFILGATACFYFLNNSNV
jgi:hypothetical protein